MESKSLTPIDIQIILYIIRKHKKKIFAIFLSTVITVLIGSFLITPLYRASSKLLVKRGQEDIYLSPIEGSPSLVDYGSRPEQRINSEIAILESVSLARQVVENIGLTRLFQYPVQGIKAKAINLAQRLGLVRFFDTSKRLTDKFDFDDDKIDKSSPLIRGAKTIQDNLKVSRIGESNVIEIVFDWPDPSTAAQVVNTLVDLYLVQHLKVHTNVQTQELLEQQRARWEERLRRSEKALDEFKQQHRITSYEQQKEILLTKLSMTESEMKKTQNEIDETHKLIATLTGQISNIDENVRLQETEGQTPYSLAALKAKLMELELQGLKEEISRVKEMIAEEEKRQRKIVVSGKSPIRQGLEGDLLKSKSQLAVLRAKARNLRKQISSYRKELEELESLDKVIKELARKVEIDEANFKLYLAKSEEAMILSTMDQQKIANVKVIEPAVPVKKVVKPQKKLNVAIGCVLGLLMGIGMAFIIEFFNPVFHTREDVHQFLGLPVIATLPKDSRLDSPD